MSEDDSLEVERLLSWTEDGATGQIPWGDDGERCELELFAYFAIDFPFYRCIQFHRAQTHTLVLLKKHDVHGTVDSSPKVFPNSPTTSSVGTVKASQLGF